MIPIAKPQLGKEERNAVLDVMSSGKLAQGEKVQEFEEKFAKYVGTDYAVACSNGTVALMMAAKCLGISGEAIVPSFSFIASATSMLFSGASPVFADIDSLSYTMSPTDIRRKITSRTHAIVPVHLYGQCADMDEIMQIAEKNGLRVIEDACQAHGAKWDTKKAGSFGDAGCFSFYPTKNMTCGEGGMVTTNRADLDSSLRLYRSHGQPERYVHASLGYNFRMTDIQAAIGVEQLKKLDKFNAARAKNAKYYDSHLRCAQPYVFSEGKSCYHQYTIRVSNRDAVVESLVDRNIGYGIYYPVGAHRQPVFNTTDVLPNTDYACNHVLSIPVHPALSKRDLLEVCEAVNSVVCNEI